MRVIMIQIHKLTVYIFTSLIGSHLNLSNTLCDNKVLGLTLYLLLVIVLYIR